MAASVVALSWTAAGQAPLPAAVDWCSFDVALPHMNWAALLRDIAGHGVDPNQSALAAGGTMSLGRGVEVTHDLTRARRVDPWDC